jgi:aryl-alcohol dehydrogenase-like predicted oxidoreductase
VVATKFGHRFTGHLERDQLWTVSDVLAQLDRSLTALGTDRIDLYQFHSGGDDVFDNDELWAELARQKTAGKIRALGLSVGSNQNLHQVAQCTDRGIDALQVVYSRLDPEPEAEVLPSAGQQDLGVLAREALAGGLLSGKYAPGTRFTNPTDARSTRGTDAIEERLQQVARIRTEEVPEGADMAAWALAWTLRHPAMTTAIAGCKSREQVESAVRAIEYVEAGHPQQT